MNMLGIYVHQTLVYITVKHVGWLVGQTKSQMKKCFFCAGNDSNHLTFFTAPSMLAG